jgi:CheY-like chemotaxis protein
MANPGRRGVLVVEDEEELRSLLAMLLEAEGLKAFEAEDGPSSLDLLRNHASEISVVITDLSLPGLGGKDLVARIRASHPDIRIIVMTGFNTGDIEEAVRQAGADEFLLKPFQPDLAVQMVRRLLGPE